jgi:ubiquitin-protein ligase
MSFIISITPGDTSMGYGGVYEFLFEIPTEYSINPPRVKCLTKVLSNYKIL